MSAGVLTPPPGVRLLTAEEYGVLPDDGRRTELIHGVVVDMPQPRVRHGRACSNINLVLRNYVDPRRLGTVTSNDTGVRTEQDPDTVRGADVSFYSFSRLPEGSDPDHYDIIPELVFEVRSPSERNAAVRAKVAEYHAVGVLAVCVVDSEAKAVTVYPKVGQVRTHAYDDPVQLPEVFPDFVIPLRQFFI